MKKVKIHNLLVHNHFVPKCLQTNRKCGNPKRPPATSQNLEPEFEAEACLIPTPEKQALIRKMRVEKVVKDKVKAVANEQEEKEVQMRAKKRRPTL